MEIPRGAQGRVAGALLDFGTATVAELAEHLDLTGAAVRRHLDELVDAGLAEWSDRPAYGPDNRRKGRGRPARFYHLTQRGRDGFGTAYQEVAVEALRFLARSAGSTAVMDFARSRVAETERGYARMLAGVEEPEAQVARLADALTESGYAAVVVPTGNGAQLCQHNCPLAHVAVEFPQFCEAETEAFGRLLGTHVMRLATLAHGDGVCTTHIPTITGRPRVSSQPAVSVSAQGGTTS